MSSDNLRSIISILVRVNAGKLTSMDIKSIMLVPKMADFYVYTLRSTIKDK
jgi:hypothetical protein